MAIVIVINMLNRNSNSDSNEQALVISSSDRNSNFAEAGLEGREVQDLAGLEVHAHGVVDLFRGRGVVQT